MNGIGSSARLRKSSKLNKNKKAEQDSKKSSFNRASVSADAKSKAKKNLVKQEVQQSKRRVAKLLRDRKKRQQDIASSFKLAIKRPDSNNANTDYSYRIYSSRTQSKEAGIDQIVNIRSILSKKKNSDKKELTVDRLIVSDLKKSTDFSDAIKAINSKKINGSDANQDKLGALNIDLNGINGDTKGKDRFDNLREDSGTRLVKTAQDGRELSKALHQFAKDEKAIPINFVYTVKNENGEMENRKVEASLSGLKELMESHSEAYNGVLAEFDFRRFKELFDDVIKIETAPAATRQGIENQKAHLAFFRDHIQEKISYNSNKNLTRGRGLWSDDIKKRVSGEKNLVDQVNTFAEAVIQMQGFKLNESIVQLEKNKGIVNEELSDTLTVLGLDSNPETYRANNPKKSQILDKIHESALAANLDEREMSTLYQGELQGIFNEKFLKNTTDDEIDLDDKMNELRDQTAIALKRLGKRIDSTVADGIFEKDYSVFQPVAETQPEQLGLLERFKQARRRKKDKVVSEIESIETGTASDVFRVKTIGPVAKIGTKMGFAKKPIKAGDEGNAGTDRLELARDDAGNLMADANLIARQVVSSRVDRLIGTNVTAYEIFAKNEDSYIGVSAQVPGKSLVENKVGGGRLWRNFKFDNPNTQKGMADLQILDAINGQLDRHPGNIFIDPKTGEVHGIDGDLAHPEVYNKNKNLDYVMKGDETALQEQFSWGADGQLKYNQLLIDKKTGDRILHIDRKDFESTLRGRKNDFENLSEASIEFSLLRFDAVVRRVQELEAQDLLVREWNADTFREAVETGTAKQFNKEVDTNYISRSVLALQAANDPNSPDVVSL